MPLLFPALAHPTVLAASSLVAATTTKKSSGSPVFFIFLIVIVGVYFLFVAPQRRKMRAQQAQQTAYEVGDEVVTKGGIFGRVVAVDGDRVRLEVAPGTSIDVLTASIARRVDPIVPDDGTTADELPYPAPMPNERDTHDGAHADGSSGDEASESDGWTEPVHEGWSEPVHEGATEPTGSRRGGDDAASGGPA